MPYDPCSLRVCEQCIDCAGNPLSMSTNNPNPSVNQSVCGDCGGAATTMNTLNAVGKWGTALTGILKGRPVAANKTGVSVGARGSTGFRQTSGGGVLFLLVLVVVIFFLMKKG